MTQSTRREPAQPVAALADPFGVWSTAFAESWLRMQQLQWEALAAWQPSFSVFGKDFWEQWASRYAGGVPIDA